MTATGIPMDQVGTMLGSSQDQVEILKVCGEERSLCESMSANGRENRTIIHDGLIGHLLEGGRQAYTITDKSPFRMCCTSQSPICRATLRSRSRSRTGIRTGDTFVGHNYRDPARLDWN